MKKTQGQKNISKLVWEWAEPISREHDLLIWDVEFKKEGSDWVLRVFIDAKDKSVSTDECEAISRPLEAILDREDPIDQSYCLEVSSPGIERVLTHAWHFDKYIGHEVNAGFFAEIDGKKQVTGVLKSFVDGVVTIFADGRDLSFEQKKATQIKLNIVF